MIQKLRNRDEGFTIIEVLIVLAIAGLILLIVFLAVPALQRSSRNTQRKNDAAAIGGAVANYISNNGGNVPTAVSDNAATNNVQFSVGTTGNVELAKLGIYTTTGTQALAAASTTKDGNVWVNKATAATITPTAANPGTESQTVVSPNSVLVIFGEDCTPTLNSRTAAVYYATETGGSNPALQCVEQ